MKFKTPGFRTHWALTLLLAALAVLFLALGNWQRDRAADKRAAQADFDAAPTVTELSSDLVDWTRARLAGTLDGERHLLLDNKIYRGRAGVHVLTPLSLVGGGALLVNRGWLPLPPDRARLPDIPTPRGRLELAGRLAPLSRPGVQLGDPAPLQAEQWPQLLVYPDWERIEAALGMDLHRQVLYLGADQPGGFDSRDWTPFTMGPDRHQAYAVQWYGLALTAVATWLALGFTAGRSTRK